MKEVIEWQIQIEKMLGDFYRYAAKTFAADEKLSGFLIQLAEEEFEHFCVMTDAAQYSDEKEDDSSIINVDKDSQEEIEGPFFEKGKMMAKGNLSKEQLIDFIVTMEFSGVNATFLYVVHSLKGTGPKFMEFAENIQKHEESIEKFVESLPYGQKYLDRIRLFHKGGQKRLLLVDDSPVVIRTLSVIFGREFIIETAENGEEGLKKAQDQYFDVIISDMEMPFFNGMDFYNKAVQTDPRIGERFLFFIGTVSPKLSDFFLSKNLRNLQKPASIKKLKQTVNEIVQS